ncbi:hypothetical protein D3C84_975580 [compost metagenome]
MTARINPVLFTDLPYSEVRDKASSSTLPGVVAHLEHPHQLLQLVGVKPYRFCTGLQHDHRLAHLCGRLVNLFYRFTIVEAAFIELLNDAEHAFHCLMQLHIFRGCLFG